MRWPLPEYHHRLFLPRLQYESPIQLDQIEASATTISIKVDPVFETVWREGPSNQEDLNNLTRCLEILCQTFSVLIQKARGNISVYHKESPHDFVTDVDTGIEMLFRIWFQRFYPSHKIIGEEGIKESLTEKDTFWYLDPIDGTTNYIEGHPGVTILLGGIRNGKPLAGIVGLPLQNELYSGHAASSVISHKTKTTADFLSPTFEAMENQIGTEYMPFSQKEASVYQRLLEKSGYGSCRVQSMGLNLLGLFDGKISAFYKNSVKFWDILAPLTLLHFSASNFFDSEIWLPSTDNGPMTLDNAYSISPFSCDPAFLKHINSKHQSDCRIGLLTVVPKHLPHIKQLILESVLS